MMNVFTPRPMRDKETPLGLRIGSVGVHACAFGLFSLVFYALKRFLSPDKPIVSWGTFALHPLLMTAAFGLCAPLAATSWRTYEDLMGLDHGVVKVIHASLMFSAVALGIAGVRDMWIVHEANAAAQIAKGWDVHFQSAHGLIGMGALSVFILNWLGGILVLYMPCSPPSLRRVFIPFHAFIGAMAVLFTLVSIITGIMTLAGRGDNHAASDRIYKGAATLAAILFVFIGLVYASPKGVNWNKFYRSYPVKNSLYFNPDNTVDGD